MSRNSCVLLVNAAIGAIALFGHAQSVPVLTALTPVHLSDFPGTPIGQVRALGVDPDGGFYVADNTQAAVFRFSATGKPIRRFGMRGDGPGELQAPVQVAVLDDTLVAVADVRRSDVNLFRRASGQFVKRLTVPGMPGSIRGGGGVMWVGAMNLVARKGVARISLATGETTQQVELPDVYVRDSPVVVAFSSISVVPDAGALVVGFAPTNFLLVVRRNRVADTLFLPIVARYGVPDRLAERIARMTSELDFYSMLSTLRALEPLAPGKVLAAHVDMTARAGATMPAGPGGPDPFTYKLYVSVINLADRMVCADLPVPFSGEGPPNVAMRADTLYVSDQDSSNADHPWLIRRFLLRDARCAWRAARVGPG